MSNLHVLGMLPRGYFREKEPKLHATRNAASGSNIRYMTTKEFDCISSMNFLTISNRSIGLLTTDSVLLHTGGFESDDLHENNHDDDFQSPDSQQMTTTGLQSTATAAKTPRSSRRLPVPLNFHRPHGARIHGRVIAEPAISRVDPLQQQLVPASHQKMCPHGCLETVLVSDRTFVRIFQLQWLTGRV